MGKITGFLEIDRHDRKYAPVAEREELSGICRSAERKRHARSGRALYGLRHSVLSRHLCVPKTISEFIER
jgi:hypothetical protein